MHLDVTNENSWRAAVDTAVRLYGPLNILVNNAGIYIRKRIEETTEDDLDQIMAVNIKGVFLVRLSSPETQNCRLCKFNGGSRLRCFQ